MYYRYKLSRMDKTLVLLSVAISILIGSIAADLPSCERARCHHCRVTFINRMCPETCRPCFKEMPTQGRYSPNFMNDSSNVVQSFQRPQAKTVSTQKVLPQHLPQNPSYNTKYNLISSLPIQESSYDSYHYQYLPQKPQPGLQPPSVRPLPTVLTPSASNQQTALIDNAFPTLPPFLTFTFPTLPPFTFPTVTFAPPIYQSAVAEIPPNQFPAQPVLQPQLFQQSQEQRRDIAAASEQSVAPYTVLSSQPQVYLQSQQKQPQPASYAVQQPANPTYPINRQPPQLPAQQLQPQRQTSYLQVQQPQQHFYNTNQQQSTIPPRPLPHSHLPQKIARPAVLPPQAYSIDAPINYIEGSYYKTSLEQPPAIAQCPRQPNWEPCITKEVANDRFKSCCQELGEGCAALCNYDATLTTIQLAVLTGRCPLNKVGDVMICASGYQDATPCCEAYHVFESGYEHCRPYCNPAAGLPQGVLLSEQYKCLGKLSQIQRCFYVSQRP
uniref:DB domain-containing protein n=1 Tax=Elaeophora elaphi TaxID=1147741 RepID=A0A0R3S5L1_9BILA